MEQSSDNIPYPIDEKSFPVPWGIIAAKTWGKPSDFPVLLIHGIQDNAGSFDRLIPYLPRGFYYVCMDLPGHGLSSRMPKGHRLEFMQYVLSVNRVVLQLKWTQFVLIGHSLGGQLSQYYTAMYPEQVTKLVVLDAYGPVSIPTDKYLDYVKMMHKDVMVIEDKMLDADKPSYTYEEALRKSVDNRRSPISEEAAAMLLPRNLKQGKNGFYFSVDQRLKLGVFIPLTIEQQTEIYSKIQCEFLLIMTNVLYSSLELSKSHIKKRSFLAAFQKNKRFKLTLVDGYHDVHNEKPEIVAPHVRDFILKKNSAL